LADLEQVSLIVPTSTLSHGQVTNEADVTRALDLARAEFGSSPYVAVNCAGIGYAKRTISRLARVCDMLPIPKNRHWYCLIQVLPKPPHCCAVAVRAFLRAKISQDGIVIEARPRHTGRAEGGVVSLLHISARGIAPNFCGNELVGGKNAVGADPGAFFSGVRATEPRTKVPALHTGFEHTKPTRARPAFPAFLTLKPHIVLL